MIKKVIMMIVAAMLMALPAVAQTFGTQQAEQPNAVFQSTSAMQGSGSTYSANPTLNADGMAAYEGASYSPAQVPNGSGPHKTRPTDHTDQPLGDAVLPLLLMSLAFCGYLYLRRRKVA